MIAQTTEITTTRNGESIAVFPNEKIELLKRTICKDSTDDELELFIHACKRTGLDPFMKQIHAVKRWDKDAGREVMAIQTGIDGYRLIADRTGHYAPGREPEFTYNKDGYLESATAHIKKMTRDGTWHEISATAHWSEYVGTKRDGKPNSMWATKSHIMLAKCAEANALRRAFPAELSGVYTSEEMQQADNFNEPQDQPATPPRTTITEPKKDAPITNGAPDNIIEFGNQLSEAFRSVNIDGTLQKQIMQFILKTKKLKGISEIAPDDRVKLIDRINAGAFDKYKTEPTTPEGK